MDGGFGAVLGSEPQLCCHWPVAVVLLFQGCERGTGNPRGNGAWNVALGHDADGGMETTYQLISVTWQEAPFDVASEGAEARKTGAVRRSYLMAMSSVRGGG